MFFRCTLNSLRGNKIDRYAVPKGTGEILLNVDTGVIIFQATEFHCTLVVPTGAAITFEGSLKTIEEMDTLRRLQPITRRFGSSPIEELRDMNIPRDPMIVGQRIRPMTLDDARKANKEEGIE